MLSLDKTDRVVINLKVIATLQEGQRLCVRNNQFSVYDEGWSQAVLRWVYGENRWVNYEDVQVVMNEAFCMLGTYCNLVHTGDTSSMPTQTSALNSVATLCREVRCAANGLNNLKKTYGYDPLMVATLDVLTERASNEIAKANELLGKHQYAPPPPVLPALPSAVPPVPPKGKAGVRSAEKDLLAST